MSRQKPFTFQAAEAAARQQALDTADLRRYAASGRAVPFTPAITATGPGLDIAYTLDPYSHGHYIVHNNMIFVTMGFAFTALTPGSRTAWNLTIPYGISMALNNTPVGRWYAQQGHAPLNIVYGDVLGAFGNQTSMYFPQAVPVGAVHIVGYNDPWAWDVTDRIEASFVARLSDGFNP